MFIDIQTSEELIQMDTDKMEPHLTFRRNIDTRRQW